MEVNTLSVGASLTPLKRCARWAVKSKINSAWKGSYLCGFGDKPSQIDGKCVISSVLFQCHHTHIPNNLSLYSPHSLLSSQEVQSLPPMQLYKSWKPTSQTWGLSRWKKAENHFKIHCTTCPWCREHGPKSDAGKPKGAYWIRLPHVWLTGLWRGQRSCSHSWWGHRAHRLWPTQ